MTAVSIHICRPETVWSRRLRHCPTCKTRRRMVVMLQAWYDPITTCCACGDSWSGGERMQRPFARGWRVESVRRARKRWAEAVPWSEAMVRLNEMVRP